MFRSSRSTSPAAISSWTGGVSRWWSKLPIRTKLWLVMLPVQVLGLAVPAYWLLREYEGSRTASYLQTCRDTGRALTLYESIRDPRDFESGEASSELVKTVRQAATGFGVDGVVSVRFYTAFLRRSSASENAPPEEPTNDDSNLDLLLSGLSKTAGQSSKALPLTPSYWRETSLGAEPAPMSDEHARRLMELAGGPEGDQELASSDAEWIRVLTALPYRGLAGSDYYAVSLLEVPKQPLYDDLRRTNLWALMLVVAGAAALLPAIHFAVARPVVGPVHHLAELMRRAAPETLGEMHVEVTRQDEIGELQQAFNAMAGEIAEKQAQLRQHKESLELRVAERTAELAARYEELSQANHALEQTKAQLESVNAELAKSNLELDAFAYTVSHDLQAPLRNVSYLVQQEIPDALEHHDDAGVRNLLAMSGQLCEFNIKMVQELLNWARISREELRKEPVDLNRVVDDVQTGLRAQLEACHATVRVATPLPVVLGDRVHLHRVLTNLITNGVKYNEQAEKVIEIGTRDLADVGPAVYVRDNGIGIEPRNMGKLFNLLVQLHKAERFGKGVGMGLAIVKKTVEAYNGRIWAESTVGSGTTFWFTFPLAEGGVSP